MKLITETFDDVELLVENTSAGKLHFIGGRFMQGGRKGVREDMNANGRIYTEDVLDSAAVKYINEKVSRGQAFGELNHPARPNIDPERIVIVVKELSKDGLHYNGKAQIVERSPLGQTIIGIMEAGGTIGVSTRALGSLKEDKGIKYVQPDLRFSAIDVVSDPAGKGCLSTHIMESISDLEWEVMEDGTILQLVRDKVKNKINEERLMKEFANFMVKINKK